jgi:periplasmic protein TonB
MHVDRNEALARGSRGAIVVGLHLLILYAIATGLGVVKPPSIIQPMEAMLIDSTHSTERAVPVATKPRMEQPQLNLDVQQPQPEIDIPVDTAPVDANASNAISDANLQVTRRVEPVYPPQSRRAGEEGTVVFNVLVDESGHPQQINIVRSSGFDKLDQSALQAIHRWMFNPAVRGSQKVAAWTSVRVTFRLQSA